jgi:hypothetical protein
VIVEVFLLALASTVRPTSLAAVSALLAGESRRRLMFAYVIAGLAFTIAFGVLVLGVFHGVHLHAGSNRTKGIADIIGGVVALLFGFAVLTGALRRRAGPPSTGTGTSRLARLEQNLTVRVAALVGPLTHIPGILYLVALNVIVAADPRLPSGLFALGIYNGIWFAVPIAALVVCIVDPDRAQGIVLAIQDGAKRHARTITLVLTFGVGTALIVRGVLLL